MLPFRVIVVDDEQERMSSLLDVPFDRAPEPGDVLDLPQGERVTVRHVISAARDGLAGIVLAECAPAEPMLERDLDAALVQAAREVRVLGHRLLMLKSRDSANSRALQAEIVVRIEEKERQLGVLRSATHTIRRTQT